jgi:hypothetical protein
MASISILLLSQNRTYFSQRSSFEDSLERPAVVVRRLVREIYSIEQQQPAASVPASDQVPVNAMRCRFLTHPCMYYGIINSVIVLYVQKRVGLVVY